MRDPYEVLGVSRTATEEEITAAYRTLAKKYHPDLHPDDADAQAKMQEINEAYQSIKSGEAKTFGAGAANAGAGNYSSGYTGQGSTYWYGESQENETEFAPVREALQSGNFESAIMLLERFERRGAAWFYYSALAYSGIGNRARAVSYARMAAEMDPFNMHYQMLYANLTQNARSYTSEAQGYGGWGAFHGMRRFCLWMIILNIVGPLCCNTCTMWQSSIPGGGTGGGMPV